MNRFDPDDTVTVVGVRSSSGAAVPHSVSLGGRNVATLVAETGRPARIGHYGADTSGSLADLGRRLGARSLAGAPITVQGRPCGVGTVPSTRKESLPANTQVPAGWQVASRMKAELIASAAMAAGPVGVHRWGLDDGDDADPRGVGCHPPAAGLST